VLLVILTLLLLPVVLVLITYLINRDRPKVAAPELRLVPLPPLTIHTGQTRAVAVEVTRTGCEGPVTVTLDGLPDGVEARPEPLTVEGDTGTLRLTASDEAVPGKTEVQVVARLGGLRDRSTFTLTVLKSSRRAGGFGNSVGMEFVPIPRDKFMMGSRPSEPRRGLDEFQHEVEITRPFYLGAFEVTQEQYETVMKKNPSRFTRKNGGGPDHPVDNVSWENAVAFCNALSGLEEERKAGRVYRLPTEAEWEYACRAGTTTAYCFGDDPGKLGEYAWYSANADGRTHEVGTKKPNAWGLYDMHGNAWEWCADWHDADYYRTGPRQDPAGPDKGARRVLRGGSYSNGADLCRSASREKRTPTEASDTFGFRVACTLR
jgi:formylglycine-generating enzyme required for sulfatase activity